MNRSITRATIASDYRLWQEYVDPDAAMTEAEFHAMSVDEKIALQSEIWGDEEPTDDGL